MRPIPRSLLPSTMTWRAPSTEPGAFDGDLGEPHTVERVRLDESRQRPSGGYSADYQRYDGPGGTVFVDARHSSGDVPPVGAVASVDGGREMSVRSVRVLRTRGGRVHHWEIEVA